MDDQTRGALLVQQESIQKEISQIQIVLNGYAMVLGRLSSALKSNPERIVFANAPAVYGTHGASLANEPSIDWNKIPSREDVGQMVQDLRAATNRLQVVQRQLASG